MSSASRQPSSPGGPNPATATPPTRVAALEVPVVQQAEHALALHSVLLRHIPALLAIDHTEARFASIETRLFSEPCATVFAFGGMSHGLAMPIREFHGQLHDTPANVLLFKNFCQEWSQKGLLGLTSSRAKTRAPVQERFGGLPRPWIFTGSSMGGFAALWFGHTMRADRVVDLGGQIYIDQKAYDDGRGKLAAEPHFDFDDPENDVRPGYFNAPAVGETLLVHATEVERDVRHANSLRGAPGVTLMPMRSDKHAIAAVLRHQGRLCDVVLGDLHRGLRAEPHMTGRPPNRANGLSAAGVIVRSCPIPISLSRIGKTRCIPPQV